MKGPCRTFWPVADDRRSARCEQSVVPCCWVLKTSCLSPALSHLSSSLLSVTKKKRRSTRSTDWKPGTPPLYAKIGTEYYVAGRGAIERLHYQVAGNLLHHGFEMLLKFTLLHKSAFNADELQDRLGHRLPDLWKATKEVVGEWAVRQDWTRFDDFIAALHRFEDIRYGEFPVGLPKKIRVDKLSVAAAVPDMPGQDVYRIDLEKADELFVVLLAEGGLLHTSWVRAVLIGPDAIADYERDNFHAVREDDG
jgi:hypothetical protein